MAIVQRFRVSFTLRGTVTVDVGVDEDNEDTIETEAAELAETALRSLSLSYPGVVEFSPGFADAQDVEEVS